MAFSRFTPCALAALGWLLVLAVPALAQSSVSALPWAGQATCALNVQQDGYSHQETQTWTITGTAPRADSNNPVYDAVWSFSGAGSTQRARGLQTISAAWNRGGAPVNTAIAISVRPTGQLVIRSWRAQLHSAGATKGVQKIAGGGQASQTAMNSDVYEWPFPVIDAAANSVDVTGSGTTVVTGGLLPMQPPSANFTAACAWHFARGGSAGAVPVDGAPASGLAASNAALFMAPPGSAGGTPVAGLMTGSEPGTRSSLAPSSLSQSSSPPNSSVANPGAGKSAPANSDFANSVSANSGGGSGAASPAAGNPGAAATVPTELCSTPARAGAPAAPDRPTVEIGPGSVTLSWSARAGGGAVDSYEVEAQPADSETTTRKTVKAPGTSATLPLSACPYPSGNCSAVGGYTFRVRAHNGAGCGPFSNSTTNIRPLVSYIGDNVAGIWAASKCLQCHTGPKVSLDLSGTASESYNRVGLYSARQPGNGDRLLACPTGGSCVTALGGAHPVGFSATSTEYILLLGWLRDGFRN
jgi:hypothetical protein